MRIGNIEIGKGAPPFVIAEVSANHNGSLDRALKIVEAAAAAGAHAIKLQTYTADTMTIDKEDGEFFITDPDSLWRGYSLYRLYSEAHTPWEWHKPIFQKARELGLVAFSSPFDGTAVDFLENLNVPAFKIASFECVDIPLIRYAASTGKPMIISTGLATVAEIDEAVSAAREAGCKELMLLKCTSSYPASPESSNILTIPHMRAMFGCEVGLSDHTLGIGAALAAVAHGAVAVEKHFTLKRSDGGVDGAFSMEPEELALLVSESESARQALGSVHYGRTEEEAESTVYRRSLYVVENLSPGDILTRDNLKRIRPGYGLEPKFESELLGRAVTRNVPKGTPFQWSMLSDS
ncbi:MAG: pseudaminic acid synthase [Wenzhouxiangella sp.]|nr:pseudaminic acid synthase [Wenzhouxiangella sp.]